MPVMQTPGGTGCHVETPVQAARDQASPVPVVELILGCMFSGKTTHLLRRIRQETSGCVATFKHRIDDRYCPDSIVAHNMDRVSSIVVGGAAEIPQWLGEQTRLVAVDDAHFFDEGLVALCRSLARRRVSVVMAALDRDSWGRPFPVIEELRASVGSTTVKYSICAQCGAVADCTQRLTPILDGRMIGGPESYEPRCRACWAPPPTAPVD